MSTLNVSNFVKNLLNYSLKIDKNSRVIENHILFIRLLFSKIMRIQKIEKNESKINKRFEKIKRVNIFLEILILKKNDNVYATLFWKNEKNVKLNR